MRVHPLFLILVRVSASHLLVLSNSVRFSHLRSDGFSLCLILSLICMRCGLLWGYDDIVHPYHDYYCHYCAENWEMICLTVSGFEERYNIITAKMEKMKAEALVRVTANALGGPKWEGCPKFSWFQQPSSYLDARKVVRTSRLESDSTRN